MSAESQESPRQLWSNFKDNTTAHGFPHISRAKGFCKKSLWLLIFLTASGFLLYHLYSVCKTYFDYNITVKISILQQYETEFPMVTLCNLNPIKSSNLNMDATLASILQEDSHTQQKKKRRRKSLSASAVDCSITGVILYKYGICYHWYSQEQYPQSGYRLGGSGVSLCRSTDGGLYQPVNQEIADFIEKSGILINPPGNRYWIDYHDGKWGNSVPATWTNFQELNSNKDAAFADVSEGNLWFGEDSNEDHNVICQKVIECPYPVYTDVSGNTYCWFAPLGNTVAQYFEARQFCHRFSHNANSLFEPQTEEAMNFFLTSYLYSNMTHGTKFWIGIYEGKWKSDGTIANWTNWNKDVVGTIGYIDKRFLSKYEWHSVAENDTMQQAMIICQVRGLRYFGQSISTSENPSTTRIEEEYTVETTSEMNSTSTTPSTSVVTTEGNAMSHTPIFAHRTAEDMPTVATSTTATENMTKEDSNRTTVVPPAATEQMLTALSTEDTDAETMSSVQSTTSFSSIPNRKPLSEEFIFQQTVIETIASLPEETKKSMGYQPYEFIVNCEYEGSECSAEMFYQHYNPIYGNCYLFNSGWNSRYPVDTAHRNGRIYGLKAILNIGEDEYLSKLGGPSGVRILVQTQSTMPHPENEGYMAEPGKLISIGVRRVMLQRKPHPYGNCTENTKHYNLDVYSESFPVKYSKQNCFRTCYQRELIRKCGCSDPYIPSSGQSLGDHSNIHVCDVNNRKENDCHYLVNLKYIRGELGCSLNCPDPCLEEYFVVTTSTATWPSAVHSDSLLARIKDKIPLIYNSSDAEKYRKNLLQVEVFFEDFNYEKIEEIVAYKPSQFASDVGGLLGLWIGCSVITLFEFLELGMDMALLALFKLCCERKVTQKASKHKKSSVQPIIKKKEAWSPAEIFNKSKAAKRRHLVHKIKRNYNS